MSLKAGSTKVSLHLYLNNPSGLQAAVYDARESSIRHRKKVPIPEIPKNEHSDVPKSNEHNDIPKNNEHSGDQINNTRSVDLKRALGFCWSLSLTPDGKITDKKLADLELNKRLKDLPCLSEVSSTTVTPDLQYVKNDHHIEQTDELNDNDNKGQRKVSEKLAEWLDEYNLVSQRQQVYLRKIHDLRQSLMHHDDKNFMFYVDRIRKNPNYRKASRRYPVYTLTKMDDKAVNHGPEPFPNRPCLLYDKSKSPKLLMAPNVAPRKLAPIVKRVTVDRYNKTDSGGFNNDPNKPIIPNKSNNDPSKLYIEKTSEPTRPEMNTMRTEYEPFESIVKRNKLDLNYILTTPMNHRTINRRLPVQMTTVTIIDEMPVEGNATTPLKQTTKSKNNRKNTTPTRLKQASPTNKQPSPTIFKADGGKHLQDE